MIDSNQIAPDQDVSVASKAVDLKKKPLIDESFLFADSLNAIASSCQDEPRDKTYAADKGMPKGGSVNDATASSDNSKFCPSLDEGAVTDPSKPRTPRIVRPDSDEEMPGGTTAETADDDNNSCKDPNFPERVCCNGPPISQSIDGSWLLVYWCKACEFFFFFCLCLFSLFQMRDRRSFSRLPSI